jgi:hypothetical protein
MVEAVPLRTSPSSGQAATSSLLRRPKLPACHSGAALVAWLDRSEIVSPHEPRHTSLEHIVLY